MDTIDPEHDSTKTSYSSQCTHCLLTFPSRSKLFRHLSGNCDPTARSGSVFIRRTARIVLAVGYLGTKFFGSARSAPNEERLRPTVEGTLAAAVCDAWGDKVRSAVTTVMTEKGSHASQNIIVLSLALSNSSNRSQTALRQALSRSDIWLLAPSRFIYDVPRIFEYAH
eukprot:gnl/MRDRNA2_/MRDRNA2_523727_c0_seq1.p1 gnl/MRDRNA2_/MRDRNA2_523727_c0~~gnl/MRDRNA2_/MRDRNA2_523727_c0_seq1.p1  ORF type:complete len:190 (+),score=19.15 gnl/MRDRNA2_/MRDRNA2_523727_c0_seq1:67-570(+)